MPADQEQFTLPIFFPDKPIALPVEAEEKDFMQKGTFKKVKPSNTRMYGPKGIIVCGYPAGEHALLLEFVKTAGMDERPVIFARTADASVCLKDLLSCSSGSGMGVPSEMPRALILSGFTQNELHRMMSAYRNAGLPAQLWATLTPISENWPLCDLLEELQREREAVLARRPTKPSHNR